MSIFANPITGFVVHWNGSGISGATVPIVNSTGSVVATRTTDVTGFYFFAATGVLTKGLTYNCSSERLGLYNVHTGIPDIHLGRDSDNAE